MKYDLLNTNLAERFKNRQDPIFHIGESWTLAKGENWVLRLYACGDVACRENGEYVDIEDVIEKYDTDEKLHKAIDDNVLEFYLNNWYEPQFFYEGDNGRNQYLELTAEEVVFTFDEALTWASEWLQDDEFQGELTKEIERLKNRTLTFSVEAEYMTGETRRYPVASDGTKAGEYYDVDYEEMPKKILIGYHVMVYENDILQSVKFYPVINDMNRPIIDDTGTWTFNTNSREVLEKIKTDYPPEKYQNREW